MFAIHAPAKVNLYLHVGPPNADGRHPLDSLVVFADANASDRISFEPGGNELKFAVTGLRDAGSVGPEGHNLVIRAVRQIEQATGATVSGSAGAAPIVEPGPCNRGGKGAYGSGKATSFDLLSPNGFSCDPERH